MHRTRSISALVIAVTVIGSGGIARGEGVLCATRDIIGSYPNESIIFTIEVIGTTALAASPSGLVVLDVADPTMPTHITTVRGAGTAHNLTDLAVAGTLAYAVTGGGNIPVNLRIYDISDPADPVSLSTLPMPAGSGSGLKNLAVAGTTAYVANGFSGLQIIDASDPNAPTIVGVFDTSKAIDVAIVGTTAYVADENQGLVIIDVADPQAPSLIGGYLVPDESLSITVVDLVAYLGTEFGVFIIDVSDPLSLELITFYPALLVYDVEIEGDRAYVSSLDIFNAPLEPGLQVLDISELGSPTLIGGYREQCWDVFVAGTTVYAAQLTFEPVSHPSVPSWGLNIIDATDPPSTGHLGTWFAPTQTIYSAQVVGMIAFVITRQTANKNDGALHILDVSDPSLPMTIGGIFLWGPTNDVFVLGSTAYVASRDAGLHIVDVSDPTLPVLLATYDTPGEANDVVVIGTTAYVADGGQDLVSGLQIIDVSDPTAPSFLGSYHTSGSANDVEVVGTTVYLADSDTSSVFSGWHTLDVSDPTEPAVLGWEQHSFMKHIEVVDMTLYAASAIGTEGALTVFDVSNAGDAALLSFTTTGMHARDLNVIGSTAFLSSSLYLLVFNVSDPEAPTLSGIIPSNSLTRPEVHGTTLYIPSRHNGLIIFDFSDCPDCPGDLNGDGPSDLADFILFADCVSGPGQPLPPECEPADLDGDGDADVIDFGIFQAAFGELLLPQILAGPDDVAVCPGAPAQMSVTAISDPPLSILDYQWQLDGVDIPAATVPTYVIDNAGPQDVGDYRCVVTGICGRFTSETASLTLIEPVAIQTQPVGGDLCEGETIFLITNATGQPAYQWFKDAVLLEGETSPFLAIPDVTQEDAGTYHATATGECNVETSDDAVIAIFPSPPQIVDGPEDAAVCPGAPVELSVAAMGKPPVSYQWQLDGVDIPGAVEPLYSIAQFGEDDVGDYQCVVAGGCGQESISAPASLTIIELVAFQTHPDGGEVCEGGTIFLIASATGQPAYQWFKDDLLLEGQTSPFLAIPDVTQDDAGAYRVEATGLCNVETSDEAVIAIIDCGGG